MEKNRSTTPGTDHPKRPSLKLSKSTLKKLGMKTSVRAGMLGGTADPRSTCLPGPGLLCY